MLVDLADMVQHLHCSTSVVDAVLSSTFTGGGDGGSGGVDMIATRENIASVLDLQLRQRFGHCRLYKGAGNESTQGSMID